MNTFITCNDLKINYEIKGQGSPIVFLHGWGGELNSWFPITETLKKTFQTITLDFPGFGKSELSTKVWGILEYAKFLDAFLTKLKINRVTLIGHSFGGTIATHYSVLYPDKLTNLVLVDAKIVKPKLTIKQQSYRIIAKSGNAVSGIMSKSMQNKLRKKLYQAIGEHDYNNSSGILRENFKNIISKDYIETATKIKTPTLLIWGNLDKATPLSDAHTLQIIIPNTRLEILSGDHFAYLQEPQKFCELITNFMKD